MHLIQFGLTFVCRPTTVDAIMFGYLAPLLRINFPRNRLKGHIESFQNIVQTIDFILRRYFPPTAKGWSRLFQYLTKIMVYYMYFATTGIFGQIVCSRKSKHMLRLVLKQCN